ncbi:unnamed protein product [[Actinomadura] parvosata subsp. kistnae]|uniref:Uncharacterized protein n=1 Tax=[Actinomadura] parvosata subsp. kistnae TaxID=1909395 RepID=A0A1U9ZZZ5_9ACTN|nr:hypothetical protein [Nonomuraea sp. ATCC 55076]AQZ63541.1 hypothetical protein BKM31_20615 [Nonomuraea sp. ATCC 55076]SPL99298.1 unnamed protein product [Actinomadura parvosata subsp. kistnae]
MTKLLDEIIEAYGGADRYDAVSTIKLDIDYQGPFWEFKGHADFAGVEEVVADLHAQRITQRSRATGRTVAFDQDKRLVTVTAANGTVLDTLTNPRDTFEGYTPDTKWSLAQIAYFRSYATHFYLPEPFLFTWPGMVVEEIEPWVENGEAWRGLSITFPENIDTHNETQKYYFDGKGLLRRMDYQPVVNGYSPTAHYVSGHTEVDGIVVATTREIFIRQEDGTPDRSWTPIRLDLSDISFE